MEALDKVNTIQFISGRLVLSGIVVAASLKRNPQLVAWELHFFQRSSGTDLGLCPSSLRASTIFWTPPSLPNIRISSSHLRLGRGLAKLYKKYKSKDFEIVSVSMDYDDAKWRNAVEKDQMEWTNLIDSEGLEGDAQLATIFPE